MAASEAEEKILAEKDVTGRAAWVRFFSELTGNLRYPYGGESLTQSAILAKLYQPDREVRRSAAGAFTDVLRGQLPTMTYIFNTLAADKASDDRLRKYSSLPVEEERCYTNSSQHWCGSATRWISTTRWG